MSVRVAATTFRPEMIGTVVAIPVDRSVYVIETTAHGYITVHDSEVVEFFNI